MGAVEAVTDVTDEGHFSISFLRTLFAEGFM